MDEIRMTFGLTEKHIEVIDRVIDDLGVHDYSFEKIAKEIGWDANAVKNWYIKHLRMEVAKQSLCIKSYQQKFKIK